MKEPQQQAANRQHARETNTQRIRFVRVTRTINGHKRHILLPTTDRDAPRVLPDTSPYLGHGYVPRKPSAGVLCSDRHRINRLSAYIEKQSIVAMAYRGDVL